MMCVVAAALLLAWARQTAELSTGLEEVGLAWPGSVGAGVAGQPEAGSEMGMVC